MYLPHYDSDGITNIKNGKSVYERLHCIPHLLIADVLFLLFVVSIAVNLFLKDKIVLIHKINNIQNGTCNIRKKHYWNYFFHLVVKSYIVSLWLSMHRKYAHPNVISCLHYLLFVKLFSSSMNVAEILIYWQQSTNQPSSSKGCTGWYIFMLNKR